MTAQLTFADRLRVYARMHSHGTTVRVSMTTEELETMATFCDLATEHRRLVDEMTTRAARIKKMERLANILLGFWVSLSVLWLITEIAIWARG